MDTFGTLDVSRETLSKLKAFEALIQKWSPKINLVSRATLEQTWERHIVDSAQLLIHAPEQVAHWVDLGSGGGFPGLVISIVRPETAVTLVESDQRKAAFLRQSIRELDLNATVRCARIETVDPLGADIVSARALAPLPKLLGYIHRHLADDGVALLPKGKLAEEEIADALKLWTFDYTRYESRTDPAACILKVERISRG